MENFLYNPIFLIFTSYGLGVLGVVLLKRLNLYDRLQNLHYLNDTSTRMLGVLYVGWLIRHSFLGKFNPKLTYTGKLQREKLRQLRSNMTDAEISHLVAFVLLLLLNSLFPVWGIRPWYIILFCILNIVGNLYLVFLQQYNKRRIDRLLKFNRVGAK